MLEVKDLYVSYGAIDALKGINLKVDEGSIVAILGANGAGKSTLLRTISGVVKAKSGSILLGGRHELLGMYPYKIA
ncbi:MAG: ATP-binding cassette domain-containing protein, partial [Clostridiales bacterium]|nr:ATP-binding cassette domain-containing protein [Clostridiales bacterium]